MRLFFIFLCLNDWFCFILGLSLIGFLCLLLFILLLFHWFLLLRLLLFLFTFFWLFWLLFFLFIEWLCISFWSCHFNKIFLLNYNMKSSKSTKLIIILFLVSGFIYTFCNIWLIVAYKLQGSQIVHEGQDGKITKTFFHPYMQGLTFFMG